MIVRAFQESDHLEMNVFACNTMPKTNVWNQLEHLHEDKIHYSYQVEHIEAANKS